jgi:hypothetical protein
MGQETREMRVQWEIGLSSKKQPQCNALFLELVG